MGTLQEWLVFLASPGDVKKERAATQKIVDDINRSVGRNRRIFLRLISWEKDTFPSFESDPQAVVNKQIAEMATYSLFVGIMWNRLGTPTPRDLSGTVEEFNRAADSLTLHQQPEIWFYFRGSAAKLNTTEQLDQRAQVLAFKKKIESRGLVVDYKDPGDFQDKLRNHILLWIDKQSAEPGGDRDAAEATMATPPKKDGATPSYEIHFDDNLVLVGTARDLELIIDEVLDAQRNKRTPNLSVRVGKYSEAKEKLQRLLSEGVSTDEEKQQLFESRHQVRNMEDRFWGTDLEQLLCEVPVVLVTHFYRYLVSIPSAAECLRLCFAFTLGTEHRLRGSSHFDVFFREDPRVYFVLGLTSDETKSLLERQHVENISTLTREWGMDIFDLNAQLRTQGFPGMMREYFQLKARQKDLDAKDFFNLRKWGVGLH